ncbi:hypothetical protein DL95DRAFT_470500 [Leptodontidium sp. 2 PMI_412]|nr:hypothetical protein DL95DRAFT_470500 [Leptodontidium sp. 2 PMI_412]
MAKLLLGKLPHSHFDPVTQDGNGKAQVDYLMAVHDLKYRLDCASRKLQHAKWSLFPVSWNLVSDSNNMDLALQAEYEAKADVLRTKITALNALISDATTRLQRQIVRKKRTSGRIFRPVPTRSIPQPSFFQRRDPTLCIAGSYLPPLLQSLSSADHIFPLGGL